MEKYLVQFFLDCSLYSLDDKKYVCCLGVLSAVWSVLPHWALFTAVFPLHFINGSYENCH